MKCRIDIKEGLIKQVIDKYETRSIARTGKNTLFVSNTAFRSGNAQSYQVAQNTVNKINKEYQGLIAHRREVVGGQEILIDPSNNLVSIYYNDYLKAFPGYTESKPLEEDARKIQKEDAKRAGIKYGDRYMFEEERPDAYFDYEKELLASTDTPVEQNIFEELSNLNFTNEVIEYLYNDSSKRLSIEKFAETVKMFAANLRGMGYTNEEVLEHIKCL